MKEFSSIRLYVIGGTVLVAAITGMGVLWFVKNNNRMDSHEVEKDTKVTEEKATAVAAASDGIVSLLQYSDKVTSVLAEECAADSDTTKQVIELLKRDGITGECLVYQVHFRDDSDADVTDEVNLQIAMQLSDAIRSASGDTLTSYYITADGYQPLYSYLMGDELCCTIPAGGAVAIVKSTNSIFAGVDIDHAEMYTLDAVTVRKAPSTDSDQVSKMDKDAQIQVVGKVKDSDWYMVKLDQGYGYIRGDFLGETQGATANNNNRRNNNNNRAAQQAADQAAAEQAAQHDAGNSTPTYNGGTQQNIPQSGAGGGSQDTQPAVDTSSQGGGSTNEGDATGDGGGAAGAGADNEGNGGVTPEPTPEPAPEPAPTE